MARKQKNRKSKGKFLAIPQTVYDSPDFMSLSGSALRLLIDISIQYNGGNNGDFTVAMGHMKKRGWTSKRGLTDSTNELLDARMIIKTRAGRFPKMCALYAITWQSVDECKGKHLQIDPTITPVRKFSMEQSNVVELRKQ